MTNYSSTRLKILASGKSKQAAANNRGKLFEQLIASVLKQRGYEITDVVSRNYAGMEIDIEGKNMTTGEPIYGECKCYSTPIESEEIQKFTGKFMARWKRDKHCAGLFIAIPSLNSHAMAFYQENFANDSSMILRVWQQSDVYNAIVEGGLVVSTDVLQATIPEDWGKCGDRDLLYVEQGLYWVQYIIPKGSAFPSHIAFFDSKGSLITDQATIDYFTELDTNLADFETITFRPSSSSRLIATQENTESIVEVRGSSDWFEYQFPASPEFFVGRQNVLDDVNSFVEEVLNKRTSSRGILFTANSGWGKSSVVLRCAEMLNQQEHFAVVIDSRTSSSSQFILRIVEYVFNKFNDFGGTIPENDEKLDITGFDGAASALIELGRILDQHNKVLFIFLDQFENLFFQVEALARIRDVFLRLCDERTNVVFGFSWKIDLISLTSSFPFDLRETIGSVCKHIPVNTFSSIETNALLNQLATEIRSTLREDLKFFLSQFSQGYPWLLKKLCAHVKSQRMARVSQENIAINLLNVEQLFQEDLAKLSPLQIDSLKRLPKERLYQYLTWMSLIMK